MDINVRALKKILENIDDESSFVIIPNSKQLLNLNEVEFLKAEYQTHPVLIMKFDQVSDLSVDKLTKRRYKNLQKLFLQPVLLRKSEV